MMTRRESFKWLAWLPVVPVAMIPSGREDLPTKEDRSVLTAQDWNRLVQRVNDLSR